MKTKRDVTRLASESAAASQSGTVTNPGATTVDESQLAGLVLSLFPGIDLLGRGFEAEGFAVVRGPDLIYGGDVRAFDVPSGRFDGVIGGPPCQDFSLARRTAATGYGLEMLAEFKRIVRQSGAAWWLLENVPAVPDVVIFGYSHNRIDVNARELGSKQNRHRHFQFGHRAGLVPVVTRLASESAAASQPCCMASEGQRTSRRSWADFCELQGLPRDFDLPGLTVEAKYRAVGNGVPVPVARAMARAIREARPAGAAALCVCGCARETRGKQATATAGCRKRLQRRREIAALRWASGDR